MSLTVDDGEHCDQEEHRPADGRDVAEPALISRVVAERTSRTTGPVERGCVLQQARHCRRHAADTPHSPPTSGGADLMAHRTKWPRDSVAVGLRHAPAVDFGYPRERGDWNTARTSCPQHRADAKLHLPAVQLGADAPLARRSGTTATVERTSRDSPMESPSVTTDADLASPVVPSPRPRPLPSSHAAARSESSRWRTPSSDGDDCDLGLRPAVIEATREPTGPGSRPLPRAT